jgi:isopentenyl diphosphate isomerase/L-lactate dehydrogenase-like FMN-dependent dehydrogenase
MTPVKVAQVGPNRQMIDFLDGHIPIFFSDGGILTASDITIALALGADSVMVGRYIVGSEESNSKRLTHHRVVERRTVPEIVKQYWGDFGCPTTCLKLAVVKKWQV